MSIRELVNTKKFWDALNEQFDEEIRLEHSKLEISKDHDIYKAQGAIKKLRELKSLREKINVRKD